MKKIYLLLLICLSYNYVAAQIISTRAGSGGGVGFSGDGGLATLARMSHPYGIAVDLAGNTYIADQGNTRIRKVTASGIISTIAGSSGIGFFGDGGPSTAALLNNPEDVAVDAAGNIYIADDQNFRVRRIDAVSGIITTVAGGLATGFYTGEGGPATAADIGNGFRIGFDPAGNLIISSDAHERVLRVDASGNIHTIAGTGVCGNSGDGGPATAAQFCLGKACFDAAGNLFIADPINSVIRKVNTSGIISTVAGTGSAGYSGDGGPAIAAKFNFPLDLAFDASHNMYISDAQNNVIRKIDNAGIVTTYAGNGTITYAGDGSLATATGLEDMPAVFVDINNNLLLANSGAYQDVFIIYPVGCSGTPTPGIISATVNTGCGPYTTTLTLSGTSVASGLTYQWQSSPDSSAWNNVAGATDIYYNALVVTPVYYRCIITCSVSSSSAVTPGIKLNNAVPVLSAISGTPTLCVGATTSLTDTATSGTWSSTNITIATVNTAGLVSGFAGGIDTIKYTETNACGTTVAAFTVDIVPPPFSGIITGSPTVCVGAATSLSDGVISGTWSSGASAIASVGSSGLVTGISAGVAVISYSVPGLCGPGIATQAVTVNPLPFAGSITGITSLCVGSGITATDAAPGGIWSSGNTLIATAGSSGVITGVSSGIVDISYSVTNACGIATTAVSVSVNPVPVVAPVTGTFYACAGSTASLSDITLPGTWSSGNTLIATVGSSGLVSGVSGGNVPISYTVTNSFGCSASSLAIFTVNPAPATTITAAGPTVFCTGASVLLGAPPGTGYNYQWQSAGTNIPGATTSVYIATTTSNYAVVVTDGAGCSAVSATVPVSVSSSLAVIPSVSITAHPGFTLCAPTHPDTFAASSINGGASPAFQWFVNGTAAGTGIAFAYIPAANDIVKCVLISSDVCASPPTASIIDTIRVDPVLSAGINISPDHTIVCRGDIITFHATPVNGGFAPVYLWTLNSVNVATGPAFMYAPNNGDVLTCSMTSSYPCLISNPITSAPYTVTVQPVSLNVVTIVANHFDISKGALDTFTVNAPDAGSSPAYQWRINGIPVPGATNQIFVSNSIRNNDFVSCKVISSNPCSFPEIQISDSIRISVWADDLNQVALENNFFSIMPNPSKGTFHIRGTVKQQSDQQVTISLMDLLGRKIYSKATDVVNGFIDEKVVFDDRAVNGIYFINLFTSNSCATFSVVLKK